MTTIKLLATGLIAITVLTTTAVAREKFAAGRTRIIVHGTPCDIFNTGPGGCWIVALLPRANTPLPKQTRVIGQIEQGYERRQTPW